jgi:monoamine oxidase
MIYPSGSAHMWNLGSILESDGWNSPPRVTPPAQPTRVLILGAGMAGLAAGYELVKAGYDVRVLEARVKAGGRVQTLREGFSEGVYAEAGATFLPAEHGLTYYYANLLNLHWADFSGAADPYIYFVKDQRIVYSMTSNAPIEWPYPLTPEEQKAGLTALQAKYGFPHALGSGPGSALKALRREDLLSLVEYMAGEGASDGAIELLNLGLNQLTGDGPSSYSAALVLTSDRYLLSHALNGAPQLKRIEGGNDLYPAALAGILGDRITYSAEVIGLDWGQSEAVVTFRDKSGQNQARADYVICTLPFSVLRNLSVTPAFSEVKTNTVQNLPYTSVTRIFLQMRKQFWRTQGLSGAIVSDQPMTQVYPSFTPAYEPGTLEVYMASENARRVGSTSLDQQIEFALSQLEMVYPEVRANLVGGVSKVWDADPFARGAYAWFEPNQMTSLIPAAARPEGRVFFAGDHTSTLPGWIQGAIASGLRAAVGIAETALSAS